MIKTLQNTLKQDREGFVLPKSVQDAIPIRRLWPDGIFQFGSKFSKTIRFSDINYAIASKEDKTSMFLGYSELLNALDTGSTTKLTINNKRLNRQDFEQKILLPRQDDYLDGYRAEYNAMLMDKVTDSSNSVVQERYITLSVHRKSIEEARTFFDRVTADVTTRLSHLDAHSEELDAVERLRVLHDFYRTGEETEFHVDLRDLMRKGHSFKDSICPDSLEFKKDYFVMGDKYGRVLFLKEYASLAYQYGLWTAASVMERGGCTDDGFIDFRGWLIAQGREVYMAALKDPDSLADAADYQDQRFVCLPHMGDRAYEELTGREIYEDFDPAGYDALKSELKQDIVYGDGIGYPYDAADAQVYLPRLCQRYMPEGVNIGTWNINSLEIRAARATAQKSKKIKKDRGDSR